MTASGIDGGTESEENVIKCLEAVSGSGAFIPTKHRGNFTGNGRDGMAGEETEWDRHLKWNKLLHPQTCFCVKLTPQNPFSLVRGD